jgi:hypothetical protein
MDKAIATLLATIKSLDETAGFWRDDLRRAEETVKARTADLAGCEARRLEYLAAIEKLKG